MEDCTVDVDLCIDCLLLALDTFIDKLSHAEAREWAESVKSRRLREKSAKDR
jgi:hypothetical protein